jgi:hypothetical protein
MIMPNPPVGSFLEVSEYLCSLIAAIAAKVLQAAALCGMHGGMAFHRNCQLLPHV